LELLLVDFLAPRPPFPFPDMVGFGLGDMKQVICEGPTSVGFWFLEQNSGDPLEATRNMSRQECFQGLGLQNRTNWA
jgi:hypothetical protein